MALGLMAGLVPPRVDASVKAGLLDLVEHANTVGGWSLRRAAATLGVDHVRVLRWQARAAIDRLDDAKPGPGEAPHALLGWERDAIVKVAQEWGEIDRSHRKLAHRGSRLDQVYVSESTVLRVLEAAGMRLPGTPAREKRPAAVAGLGRTRARRHLNLRLHPLHHRETLCGRGPRCGVLLLAVHSGLRRGVVHPGRCRVHPRPVRRRQGAPPRR
jgi:hypothetical protein